MEIHFHVGPVYSPTFDQYIRYLCLVLPAHAATLVHEQDSEIRYTIQRSSKLLAVSLKRNGESDLWRTIGLGQIEELLGSDDGAKDGNVHKLRPTVYFSPHYRLYRLLSDNSCRVIDVERNVCRYKFSRISLQPQRFGAKLRGNFDGYNEHAGNTSSLYFARHSGRTYRRRAYYGTMEIRILGAHYCTDDCFLCIHHLWIGRDSRMELLRGERRKLAN